MKTISVLIISLLLSITGCDGQTRTDPRAVVTAPLHPADWSADGATVAN